MPIVILSEMAMYINVKIGDEWRVGERSWIKVSE